MKHHAVKLLALCAIAAAQTGTQTPKEPGLLFYLSGEQGLQADYAAGGDPTPSFQNNDVRVLPNGAKGNYIQCGDKQVLAYWAPGNIYAQRGTLSFYWRSRYPVGKTAFPVFRVGYADHSSWDMVWLRIDYNGKQGFDAFVTDVNLGRTRVSYTMPQFPKPGEWVHLALAWDEHTGIQFYVNGKFAMEAKATGLFDAALDQFGPHSRAINSMQVQSDYNFVRGGDIDELRIYDRPIDALTIAALAGKPQSPQGYTSIGPDIGDTTTDPFTPQAFDVRYGWNRPGDMPPQLPGPSATIRKVEIHDVYDLKRWWWKATDGIRETTWPGVYNRSRLPNRNDYFQLPDWDCYTQSGKAITFFMPNEPWNQLEISGGAFGNVALLGSTEKTLFERPKGQEHTFHRLAQPITGQKIRFTNVEQETPIGELSAYYVHEGKEPAGIATLRYRLQNIEPDNPNLKSLTEFIEGRYPAGQRMTIVAMPTMTAMGRAAANGPVRAQSRRTPQQGLPLVHILVPADFREVPNGRASYTWDNMAGGLDGIAIDLPALNITAGPSGLIPLNIQVKDPLWPMRNMLDFSFSVKPGEAHTLWLDLRDRILPHGKPLYITIASASGAFGPANLEGTELRLIFKPYKDALPEHILDRFTQVRDNYANMVEEHPNSKRLHMFARYELDITDLLRVDPDNKLGREYWYDMNKEQAKPPYTQPTPPTGVPLWAFRQVENLRYLDHFINWYIDNRQLSDGELGGGLSDDGDLTNWWPGTALMGVTPAKIQKSLAAVLDGFYNQHMFTNGLSTIQADELHSYEEGISCLGENLTLDFGSPKQLERAMETAKRLEWLTGRNAAGHMHIRSSYFNGEKMADEEPWNWSKPNSYLVFHPALLLVQFNGTPETRKLVLDLADGLIAHRKAGANGRFSTHTTINFQTDEDQDIPLQRAEPLLWAAYRWTGDHKYLDALLDQGQGFLRSITANALDILDLRKTWGQQILNTATPQSQDPSGLHFAWQVSGDRRYLETLYGNQMEAAALREYINTEGSLWIDRVSVEHTELQRARLGGVAIIRNGYYPGHAVSWAFDAPASGESVAILVPESTPDRVKITAYNLEQRPVKAHLTGGEIEPGKWQMVMNGQTTTVDWERAAALDLTLPPRTETTIELKLVTKGTPYWSRPDLGIGEEDVHVENGRMRVMVHSLGAVDAPASRVVLRDAAGKTVATAQVPALKAPVDLVPKRTEVTLAIPAGWKAGTVSVEMDEQEITRKNNRVAVTM